MRSGKLRGLACSNLGNQREGKRWRGREWRQKAQGPRQAITSACTHDLPLLLPWSRKSLRTNPCNNILKPPFSLNLSAHPNPGSFSHPGPHTVPPGLCALSYLTSPPRLTSSKTLSQKNNHMARTACAFHWTRGTAVCKIKLLCLSTHASCQKLYC